MDKGRPVYTATTTMTKWASAIAAPSLRSHAVKPATAKRRRPRAGNYRATRDIGRRKLSSDVVRTRASHRYANRQRLRRSAPAGEQMPRRTAGHQGPRNPDEKLTTTSAPTRTPPPTSHPITHETPQVMLKGSAALKITHRRGLQRCQ